MTKPLSLKYVADKHNIPMRRLRDILLKLSINPRSLSNAERRDMEWKGCDKRALKGEYIDAECLDSLVLKMELVRHRSQHDINEALGQMTLEFE